jgi:hypothetical protein
MGAPIFESSSARKSRLRAERERELDERMEREGADAARARREYLMIHADIIDKLQAVGIDPYELRDLLNGLPD